jgi:hypothetical protein
MISIFATSIRPYLWARAYETFKRSTTRPFEVVFTSPYDKIVVLPDNFRVIKTGVKPSQALEAAARACKGDLIMGTTDDLIYESGALDLMADAVESAEKTLASAQYWVDGRNEHCYHEGGAVGVPGLTPLCPMMRARDWRDAGGTDPIFCCSYGYDDLVVRLQMDHWKTVLVDRRVTEVKGESDLWNSSGNVDLQIIRALWCDGSTFTGQRSKPPGFYTDATLLIENQGEVRGNRDTRWR